MVRTIWADETGAHAPSQYPEGVFEVRGVTSDWPTDLYLRVCQLPMSGIWVFAFDNYADANQCPLMPLEGNIEKPQLLCYAEEIDPMPVGTPRDATASFDLTPSPANPSMPLTEVCFYGMGIRKTENPGVAWHMVWGGLMLRDCGSDIF